MEFKESEIGLIRYVHENDYNYLVLLEPQMEVNYKLQMIEKNHVKGILETHYLILDETIHIKYNISSKVSLKHFLEKRKIDEKWFFNIMGSILDAVEELNLYLLDSNQLLLNQNFIFINIESEELEFCYLPYVEGDFVSSFQALVQELLQNVEYADQQAVECMYALNTWCSKGVFSIKDLKGYIQGLQKKEEPIEETTIGKEASIKNSSKEVTEEFIKSSGNERKYVGHQMKEMEQDDKFGKLNQIKEKYVDNVFEYVKKKLMVFKTHMEDDYDDSELLYEDCVRESAMYDYCTGRQDTEISGVNMQDTNIENEQYHETVYISEARKNTKRSLISLEGKQTITIEKYPFFIGKLAKNVDAVIQEHAISRMQSKVDYSEGKYYIEDLNSKNGTYINDERIEPYEVVEIQIGDRIGFAEFDYIFR
jgi:hypothetical protein